MPLPEWDEYLNKVVGCVKFRFDRKDIRRELSEHMEDMYEDMISDGIEKSEAERLTVNYMGDPLTVGEALNREHSPFLGRLWLITRCIAVLVIVLSIPSAVSIIQNGIFSAKNYFFGFDYVTEAEELYSVTSDVSFEIDNVTVKIRRLVFYDDDSVVLEYDYYSNPFERVVNWSFILRCDFYDQDGNEIKIQQSGMSHGWYSAGSIKFEDFPKDTEVLVMDYNRDGRQFHAEMPLKEEGAKQP